ncbi:hypothetical protein Tco_1179732 [Tanacetum coccineum]
MGVVTFSWERPTPFFLILMILHLIMKHFALISERRWQYRRTTSHSDLSLLEYDSFHFDLSIDPLPPADRSDSHLEEFADEFAHIISPPEYDHFYFDLEDISSLDPPESTPVIDESTLLVTHFPILRKFP